MPVILAGDFNVSVKDHYNAKLVELSQRMTRSNSCIDMVFGRKVDHLSCMNYVSYFSYHRPILSRTNHQAPQLTNVTTN
jgi:hypothetical protein